MRTRAPTPAFRVQGEAGTDGPVLTIGPPGKAPIHAVDAATGAPRYGTMVVAPIGTSPREQSMPGPTFQLTEPRGEYGVAVTTPDHRVGAARVSIRSGETANVELALAPAALLTIARADEGPPALFRYRHGDVVCVGMPLRAGERRTFAVPAGAGRVELVRGTDVLFQRHVELTPGPTEIEFDGLR